MHNVITSPQVRLMRRKEGWSAMDITTKQRWSISDSQAEALNDCRVLRPHGYMIERYAREMVDTLLSQGLLWDDQQLWNAGAIRAVEIETTTFCNWRCAYCPSSGAKREREVMPLPLFDQILQRIAAWPEIRCVTLHYFNEPTLDPLFDQRVERIRRQGLRLLLFTNGSGLNRNRLETLAVSGIVEQIYFTFPSCDEAEFNRLTGTVGQFSHSAGMIRAAKALGLDVRLSVQGEREGKKERLHSICQWFGLPRSQIAPWETFDRAGNLDGVACCPHTRVDRPRLAGCGHILQRLYVDVQGNLLLCDQDFAKTARFGSVCDADFDELLHTRRAQQYKRWIFGAQEAPDDFLCRRCQRMQNTLQRQRKEAAEHKPSK